VAKADSDDSSDDDGDVDKEIDDTLAQLPPDALAQLPAMKKALKKYGSFAKIPKAERIKLAHDMMNGGLAAAAGDQVADALAGAKGKPADPVATPSPPPASGGWFTRHDVSPPGFDAKKASVEKFVAFAIAEAKRNVPDAELTRIDVDGVFPDGHADLTLPSFASSHGSIDVRFISPSHAKRDPNVPRGVRQEKKCEFRVMIGPEGGEMYDMITGDCKTATVPKPRCTIAAVWKKALARKKDLADAVASITYTSNIVSHKIVWMFDVRDGTDTVFSEQFSDDC
jgi:hypothetical protein